MDSIQRAPAQGIALERVVITLFTAVYLWLFRTVIYSGDALVYTGHVEAGLLVWNPNHLLMDPVAYGWCHLLWSLGIDISAIDALKIISGVAAIASLVLFHSVLLAAGVTSTAIRLLAVLGLFASRNFLSMAISEEFFMLEMPLLMLALWMVVKLDTADDRAQVRWSVLLGATLGLATAISVNHVVLGLALAVWFLVIGSTPIRKLQLAVLLGAGAAAVCVPLFLLGYALSDANDGFVNWLVAYQGSSENPLAALYGLQLTPKGIATSIARLGLNTFTNFMSVGSLGTVMKSLVFGSTLEMQPEPVKVVLGLVLLVGIIVTLGLLVWWLFKRLRAQPLVQVGLIWVASFYVFNFFWDDSSDQFWFQVLPVLWLFFAMYAGEGTAGSATGQPSGRGRLALMAAVASVLLVFNTAQEVVPKSFVDLPSLAAEHNELVRAGDLEIIPGWDDIRWIQMPQEGNAPEQVSLMQQALGKQKDPEALEKLTARMEDHLRAGGRVIVARLYDRDREARPWDQLRKLGWERERILAAFERFESRELGKVDDVVFRELKLRADP